MIYSVNYACFACTEMQIVTSCKGSPFAIEIIGKSLCGKPSEVWQDMEGMLNSQSFLMSNRDLFSHLQKTKKDLLSHLLSCLDILDEFSIKEKDCFVDLALFPEGKRIFVPALIDMWAELYELGEDGKKAMSIIDNLTNTNLVNVIDTRQRVMLPPDMYYNNHFLTYEDLLIRELTIHLSSQEPFEQRKRLIIDLSEKNRPEWWVGRKQQGIISRLLSLFFPSRWMDQNPKRVAASTMSISTDETFTSDWCNMQPDEAEVLVLNIGSNTYTLPAFTVKMSKLKVLIVTNYRFPPSELENCELLGSLPNLKRIRFDRVSIPQLCKLESLQKLSIYRCDTINAFGSSSMKISDALPNLKELNIDYCKDMEELPSDICKITTLEKLSITFCHNLFALPRDIGNLENLEVLRLSSCSKLVMLPDSVVRLHKLRFLDISDCAELTQLPRDFGELLSLKKLYMWGCSSVKELPPSVMNFKQLEHEMYVFYDDEETALWDNFFVLPNLKKGKCEGSPNLYPLPDANAPESTTTECTESKSDLDVKHRDQYQHERIHDIVAEASRKLNRAPILSDIPEGTNRAPLLYTGYVVGLESPMEEVSSLLELDPEFDEVLMMGIYGVSGIGKTTLAIQIYNKIVNQFQASCVLFDVRERSSTHGLVYLQNMLLTYMLGGEDSQITNVDIGASLIKNRLHSKKVLLILDDVDKLEQLEALVGKPDWFGPGSRVIITTRDKHLLTFHKVETIYEVQLLNPDHALKLLSHHILKQGEVDSSYTEILEELVSYALGHPLALIVIASYLFGNSVEQWPDVLHKFKRIPPEDIQNTHKTSFDALREDEKNTFLDIACCFQGYELVEALKILCAHRGDDVKLHIDVLKEKSLVSISSIGMVTLHPLIEGMGKEIVRQEDPKEPGKRSRLWFPRDIVEVLKSNKGTDKIEIIHLDSPFIEDEETIEWDGNAFKEMENLRTLIIRKCNFSKAPKYLPQGLSVLDWWRYPSENLPSDFNPNQLVICKLPIKGIKLPKLVELAEASPSGSQVPHTSPNAPQILPSRFPQTLPIQNPHSPPSVQRTSPSQVPRNNSQIVPLAPPNSQTAPLQVAAVDPPRDPEPIPPAQAPLTDSNPSNIWRIVGLLSSVVGLPCFAFSPSFVRLIRGWNTWKFILYYVISWGVVILFLYIKQSAPPVRLVWRVWYKIQGFLVLMSIAVYTFYYDKAVDGKPEIRSLVSNAAFVLMSLSYSKLRKLAYEMGVFSFFLSCLTVQLWTINMKLIWIPICFGFPLFFLHESSDPVIR